MRRGPVGRSSESGRISAGGDDSCCRDLDSDHQLTCADLAFLAFREVGGEGGCDIASPGLSVDVVLYRQGRLLDGVGSAERECLGVVNVAVVHLGGGDVRAVVHVQRLEVVLKTGGASQGHDCRNYNVFD